MKPDLVVCDSQVVDRMVLETPADIVCTTFSILFTRFRGDLNEIVWGVLRIKDLKKGYKILIAEACSHHPLEDDIGRVKSPKWLKGYSGAELDITTCSGADSSDDLSLYRLVIHCGGFMINKKLMLSRIQDAKRHRSQ